MPATPTTTSQRFGDYYLTAHLGRGGMADVYLARYVGPAGFQRTVVIKRILNVGDPEGIRMFINEAKLAAELTHPNIVQIYELGELDGEFFIAMEYIRGKDLGKLLNEMASRKVPIQPVVAAYVAREVCRALAHAHAHAQQNGAPSPIIHRDVSPANIIISYDGQVKLVDFGIAKALYANGDNAHTQAGIIKGKLGYMAPEQMDGLAIPQSDLFSTGVVFHEMLTLRRLIKGGSSLETMTKLKTMPFPPPSMSSASVPPALDAIALKALDRNLDVRYANATIMAKELDLFVQAAGFSVEDMSHFMNEVYPVETQGDAFHYVSSPARISTQISRSPVAPSPPAATRITAVSPSMQMTRPFLTRRKILLGTAVLLGLMTLGGYSILRRSDATATIETPAHGTAGALAVTAVDAAVPQPPREPGPAPLVVRGVTDSEIVFGMAGPLSGSAKEYGRQMKVGIETAFQVVNDKGGIYGRRLRLVAVDDGYEPTRTTPAIHELYETYKVFGFLGNFGTPTAAVSLPFALEHKMLFFGAYTGANLLRRDPPDRYVFNYRASYVEEGAAIVKYLLRVRHIRPDHIVVFAQDDAFGEAVFGGIAKAMRNMRPDVLSIFRVGYHRNTIDVEDAVNQMRARTTPTEAVVLLALSRASVKFIEQVRSMNRGAQFITGSWIDSAGLAEELKMLGPRFASGVVVTQVVPSTDSSATAVLDFKAAMAKYLPQERPESTSLEAYLMTNLLIEGLRRAGRELDIEKLVGALEEIRDFDLGIGALVTLRSGEHQGSHRVWGIRLDDTGRYQPIDLE